MSEASRSAEIDMDHMAPKLAGRVLWFEDGRGSYRLAGWNADREATIYSARWADVSLLDLCDGTRPLQALATQVGSSTEETRRKLSFWNERLSRSFSWKSLAAGTSSSNHRAAVKQILREMQAIEDRTTGNHDSHGYHVNAIGDAWEQFENVETTVSHAYAQPHSALGGRSYGQAFFDRCHESGFLKSGCRIIEIGCGTGRFAHAFLDRFAERMPQVYETSTYTLFDLSPSLTASQRAECVAHSARVLFENGDIETCQPGGSFDLVIMNEVIADLSVVALSRADVENGIPEARYVVRYELSLDGALDRFLVNSGAIRVIERLRSLLRPHGVAVISEYGSLRDFPTSIHLGGHVEYSIHFGHVLAVASQLGFLTAVAPLTRFLGFSPTHEVIAADSLALLRRVAKEFFGTQIEARAYDRDDLRQTLGSAFRRLGHIRFAPVGDAASFMSPEAFYALTVRHQA